MMRDAPQQGRSNRSFVSLFSGAGGLDIGLEEAGLELRAAVDFDEDSIATLRLNQKKRIPVRGFPNRAYLDSARLLHEDVTGVSASDLFPERTPDLLAGGPPCQPFSASGKQESLLDRRGRLFEEFVRLTDELRPKFVLFENVRGLVTARGMRGEPGRVLEHVREAFQEVGYATTFALLNAADYGCPQRRIRLFMVGTQRHGLPEFPQPTHTGRGPNLLGLEPWTSLGTFLAKMPPAHPDEVVRPSPKLAPLLENLSDGTGLKSPGRRERTRPGGHWGYKQGTFIADPNLPARTVTAASTQDWVRLGDGSLRRLTLTECARLQGFPPDWEFIGTKTSRFRQVGNAVPAVFGRVIGRKIIEMLNAPMPERPPKSAPLPGYMLESIEYTRRDHDRNRESRPRAQVFAD